MIKEELDKRKIPYPNMELDYPTLRKQALDVLCSEEYGYIPDIMPKVECIQTGKNERAYASKAISYDYIMKLSNEKGVHEFPFVYVCPKSDKKVPAIIHNNFRRDVPDRYTPAEEIVDNGFAFVSFCYEDVTSDDNDFANGLAGLVFGGERKGNTDASKIVLWAWASMRILDFLETRPEIDSSKVAVCGHSRLGKTALVTGALDERFSITYSNDSGCSGAAITRNKIGETIANIHNSCPHWSCYNYAKYRNNEDVMPFDQHYLGALIAPRAMYIASAEEDKWADPDSEYLCAVASSAFYEKLGVTGFVHPDRLPVAGDVFHEGNIGYHLRKGSHYFSRTDWVIFMQFAKKYWNM
ncbi:MAG: acetylxylan esterase [Firmicutes bacterium]|nr:acetylxylan esterase [Bacillota bacterium]